MIGLKYIMFITDTSLKDIASELNVTPQLIAAWNKGTRNIGDEYKSILSKYFNLDEKYFSKEITLEDKINIELKIENKTYLNKEIKDLSKITEDINSMRSKYSQLLDKYISLSNEHENLKDSIRSISRQMFNLIN